MLRSSSILHQPGSTPCRALQPVARNQKLKHLRRKLCPWAAVGVAACLTRVTPLQRAWQTATTRAWSALHLTPSPRRQRGVCHWMEVAEVEERNCLDQYETIPVTVMRDVPPGDQGTGRTKSYKAEIQGSLRKSGWAPKTKRKVNKAKNS